MRPQSGAPLCPCFRGLEGCRGIHRDIRQHLALGDQPKMHLVACLTTTEPEKVGALSDEVLQRLFHSSASCRPAMIAIDAVIRKFAASTPRTFWTNVCRWSVSLSSWSGSEQGAPGYFDSLLLLGFDMIGRVAQGPLFSDFSG
jgi:hypothetical protein